MAALAWDAKYSGDFREMQHKKLLSMINVYAGIQSNRTGKEDTGTSADCSANNRCAKQRPRYASTYKMQLVGKVTKK
jgi:hypothetical protein